MLCRECKQKMLLVPVAFDARAFLQSVQQHYCNNKDCKYFGFVTVAGLPEEKEDNNN